MNNSANHSSSNLLNAVKLINPALSQPFETHLESLMLVEVFRRKGVDISLEEAICPVGMELREYLRILIRHHRIAEEWIDENGRECHESDIEEIINSLTLVQLQMIEENTKQTFESFEKINIKHPLSSGTGLVTGFAC